MDKKQLKRILAELLNRDISIDEAITEILELGQNKEEISQNEKKPAMKMVIGMGIPPQAFKKNKK